MRDNDVELEKQYEGSASSNMPQPAVSLQVEARTSEQDALRRELKQWQQHAENLELRINGQEHALRQISLRNAYLQKLVHDNEVTQRAEQIVREVDRGAPDLQRNYGFDSVNLGASLENPLAHAVLYQIELGQRKAQNDQLRAEVELLKRDKNQLEQDKSQLEHDVVTMLRSSSWRLTSPLRQFRRLLDRYRRQANSAGQTIAGAPTEISSLDQQDDFDAAYYVKLYPDVLRANVDPYQHYLRYGKVEGRIGKPASLLLKEKREGLRADKDYILVVSHEATRTGAPVLAWNICNELSKQYNVVVLLLGDGEIVRYFEATAGVLVGPYAFGGRDMQAIKPVVEAICKRYPFRLAIVNSLASRAVLQPLAEQFVPSVFLVHEFFKLFCSPDQLVDAMAWAGRTVFSAEMVRESATIERTRTSAVTSRIIPQGKSIVPAPPKREDAAPKPNALENLIAKREKKPFIVLGAGTVEYRKGVDLFIATATEIRRQSPDADILMVWVGRVVDIYRDYAEFITMQIEQSTLKGRFELLEPTSDLERIYELSDLCFISSRLDPLPNIAIDAMAIGLPVLCFEGCSGVAENLIDDPIAAQGILPYLNVEEAARKILELYHDASARSQLSQSMLAIAKTRFDMSNYVGRLLELGAVLSEAVEQERLDVQTLLAGDAFKAWFYLLPESGANREEAVREYVKSCQGRIYARKATPGFYPHVYAEHHDLTDRQINPLVHFVQSGSPAGPWQEEVININTKVIPSEPVALRVALQIHAFYPELLDDIIRQIESNRIDADLFVSVPSPEAAVETLAKLNHYISGKVEVRIVPNRGRDIGPLITEFASDLMDYDVVGHFHTKKSVHVVGSNLVQDWLNFLIQNLIGGEYFAARTILDEFAANPKLGLVFADDPNSIGWDKNLPFGEVLAERMGIDRLPAQFFSFPVGTMFWARPEALKPLFDLELGWEDFPQEPLPIDGSLLHAIERILPTVVRHANFGVKVTSAAGISR